MVGFIILKKKAGDFYRGIPRGIAGVPGLTFRKMLAACVGRAMGDFCLSYMSTEEAHSRGGVGWWKGMILQAFGARSILES